MTGLAMRSDLVIVHVERRSEEQKRKKQPRHKLARPGEGGPLMSVPEFAKAVGQTARQVRNHIDKGRMGILRRAPDERRVWIPRRQLERAPAVRHRRRPSQNAVDERIKPWRGRTAA